MNKRSDILFVGQTPPPYHGQAVVTKMLFDHDWGDLRVDRLRMSYSDTIDAVGKASLGKILHLLTLIVKTWWIALIRRPRILYYLPASANRIPVLRDVIYLMGVRWIFPRTVFHYHAGGLPEYLQSAGWFGGLARRVYSNADVSVEICRTDSSPGKVFHARKTIYVPNGLDVEVLPRNRPLDAELRVFFLGALNEGKGVLDVLRTASILKARGCKLHFQLVGAWASDAFRKKTLAFVESENLEDIIEFSGVLKGENKWRAYADADIFFFPSHYQSENFPLVLIEAMALGLPVVSTTWRGIPQLIGDSNSAVLCDINAPDQYADALQEILKNLDKRQQMGVAARRYYENHYTRDKFVAAMEEVFQSVLKSGSLEVGKS